MTALETKLMSAPHMFMCMHTKLPYTLLVKQKCSRGQNQSRREPKEDTYRQTHTYRAWS